MARKMSAAFLLHNRAVGRAQYPIHVPNYYVHGRFMLAGMTTGQTYKQQRAWAIQSDSKTYPGSHKTRIGH